MIKVRFPFKKLEIKSKLNTKVVEERNRKKI
jgi:hypothetical protein